MRTVHAWLWLILVAAIPLACSNRGGLATVSSVGQPVAKLRVYADGKITVDDRQVTVDELGAALANLKTRGGAVWYYREAAATEPSPSAMAVMQAIVEARLPVSLSSKEDFSNVVLQDGTTKPR